jgi:hypothetical protein
MGEQKTVDCVDGRGWWLVRQVEVAAYIMAFCCGGWSSLRCAFGVGA